MRVVMLLVAAQLGWMLPACAEGTPETDRSLRDTLPLFEKNRCAEIRNPAAQLFCGDPDLQGAGIRLNAALQDRLNRMADRRIAVEENVEWIQSRNLRPEVRTGEGSTRKPGKPAGRTPAQNRKVVRVSEIRRQRLALHDIRAAAGRTWGRDARPMMRLGYRIQDLLWFHPANI